MKRFAILTCCLILLGLLQSTAATAHSGDPVVPPGWSAVSETGPWVVRIELPDQATAQTLSQRFDVWHILHEEGVAEALVSAEEYAQLVAEGYSLSLAEEHTRELELVGKPLAHQGGGISGFPCYRTVEETFATAQAIADNHPGLASWVDIGDSWQKIQDPDTGYDMRVLKLTRASVPGPKPAFFASFAIHAREYATAELGTRFAEYLVDNYNADPNVTWLLDHHEVHLLLQANPDGRKQAESGLFWRKNANNDYCSNTNDRGADLNRNFAFEWNCCGGSSGSQCSTAYRGPAAASEPEIQAHQDYVVALFPDQRADDLTAPAPDDATGVAIDVHSFGSLVMWPWGLTNSAAPNGVALTTFGRKLAFFNNYSPIKITQLTIADGSSADFYYGELGVAGMAYELGNSFFESCSSFENNVVPQNIPSLFYAARNARTPYLTPAGPEAIDVMVSTGTVSAGTVSAGDLVQLTATLDDTRFNNSNGSEPTQTIAAAEAFVGTPPWGAGALPLPMASADGTFDEDIEEVVATLDTTGLAPGRHLVYVQGTDADGNTGMVGAAFLTITGSDVIFADDFESGNATEWPLQSGL